MFSPKPALKAVSRLGCRRPSRLTLQQASKDMSVLSLAAPGSCSFHTRPTQSDRHEGAATPLCCHIRLAAADRGRCGRTRSVPSAGQALGEGLSRVRRVEAAEPARSHPQQHRAALPGQVAQGSLLIAVDATGLHPAIGTGGHRGPRVGDDGDMVEGGQDLHDGQARQDQGQGASGQKQLSKELQPLHVLTPARNRHRPAREQSAAQRRHKKRGPTSIQSAATARAVVPAGSLGHSAPDPRHPRRVQALDPLCDLSDFSRPPLP